VVRELFGIKIPSEQEMKANPALAQEINDTLAAKVLDQEVLLNNVPFRVKGVLVGRGASPAEGDRDARLIVPFTTFYNRLYKKLALDQIIIQLTTSDIGLIQRTEAQVREVMRQQHHIADGQPDNFTVRTPQSVAAESRQISRSVFVLLLGLAA